MARKVLIADLCDVCLFEYGREESATFSGRVRLAELERDLALCEDHRGALVEPLAQAAMTSGHLPEKAATSVRGRKVVRGPLACPICTKPVTDRAALASHIRRTHDRSIEDVEAGLPSSERFYQCRECDAPPFASTQQLGAHVYNRHRRLDDGPNKQGRVLPDA